MAIGTPVERYCNGAGTFSTSSQTFSPASTIQAGTKAIMCVSLDGGNAFAASVTDNAGGNTWRLDHHYSDPTAGAGATFLSCDVATAITTSNTITVNYSGTINITCTVWIHEVTGLATGAGSFDASADGGSASKTISVGPTATLAQASEIAFCCAAQGNTLTGLTPSTWTGVTHPIGAGARQHSCLQYQIVNATTALTGDGLMAYAGGAIAYGGTIATYKASAAVAPANTVAPVASGTATVGQVLSTTDGTWTGSPSPTFTYQWQRDTAGNLTFANISSATSSTYTLVDADDGNKVRCVVTGTNASGNAAGNSNALGLVIEPAPTNSVLPALGGVNATVGSSITVTTGTWANMAGAGGSSYTYQWRDCATSGGTYADIVSATASSYTVGAGESTKFLKCVVTAHNTNGSTGSATTVASNQVAAAPATASGGPDPSKTASAVVLLGL